MFWKMEKTVKNVKNMYDYTNAQKLALLSDFTSVVDDTNDFWSDYKTNYQEYDKMFCRMYKSYRYFNQEVESENEIADVTLDFIDAVKTYLRLNDKKFSQLYKLYRLENETPFDDVNIIETTTEDKDRTHQYISGQRLDSSSETLGGATDTVEHQQMAFNSTTYENKSKDLSTDATRTNTASTTKGSQTDNETETNDNEIIKTTTGMTKNQNENILTYQKVWNSYEFYYMIFRSIASELLLV